MSTGRAINDFEMKSNDFAVYGATPMVYGHPENDVFPSLSWMGRMIAIHAAVVVVTGALISLAIQMRQPSNEY